MNKINEVNYNEELKSSYQAYAKQVALSRAIPDIKDGLKPVQRRIIYTMAISGNTSQNPYRKSARIVGDVMGKYHPHSGGLYEALVNLAQPFSMLYPLVDGQGNFGSIDGDQPAAQRYTEAKLTQLANELTTKLKKNTVLFSPNFDDTLEEPDVLPTQLPLLLLNGAQGIAVGVATNIPSHNLGELIDASIHMLQTPNMRNTTLFNYIQGPDFPCGGRVLIEDIESLYEKGQGSVRVFGSMEQEQNALVITEIPQPSAGNKTGLIKNIIDQVNNGKIPEIIGIEDQSDSQIRIVLKCKRGSDLSLVEQKVYCYTDMQINFNYNFVAVDGQQIMEFGLRDYLERYIAFIREVKEKELTYDLGQYEKRQEDLHGLIFANENIELVIEIITKSKTVKQARNCFIRGETKGIAFATKKMEKQAQSLRLSERQCDVILGTKLSSLVNSESIKLRKELKELVRTIKYTKATLNTPSKMDKVLISDLQAVKKAYNRPRRTEIISELPITQTLPEEADNTPENLTFLLDGLGYFKFVKETDGGINLQSSDRISIFTDKGSLYYLDPKDIGVRAGNDKGEPIEGVVGDEKVLAVLTETALYESKLLFVTSHGFCKKTSGEDYRPTGTAKYKRVQGTKLESGDEVLGVAVLDEGMEDLEITSVVGQDGMYRVLRFSIEDVPENGRGARGSYALNKKYLPLKEVVFDNFRLDEKNRGKRGGTGKKFRK